MTGGHYSHANQKPGWRCTCPDPGHFGPCALEPVLQRAPFYTRGWFLLLALAAGFGLGELWKLVRR